MFAACSELGVDLASVPKTLARRRPTMPGSEFSCSRSSCCWGRKGIFTVRYGLGAEEQLARA